MLKLQLHETSLHHRMLEIDDEALDCKTLGSGDDCLACRLITPWIVLKHVVSGCQC